MACWRTKAAISLKRVKIEEKLLWTPDGLYEITNALSNGIIPNPIRPPFPNIEGSQPPLKTAISNFGQTSADRGITLTR